MDIALNIYKGHLIGWSSLLFLPVLLYYVIFKQIQNKKNPTLSEQFQNPIKKSQKRGQMYTPNTEIYNRSLSLVDTVTLLKSGQVKLVLRSKISPLREMMRSYKSFTTSE